MKTGGVKAAVKRAVKPAAKRAVTPVAKRAGRPPKFAREQLQVAALAIVDVHGLAELSMRSLARALETGPMTLYNHVSNRDDLDALVVDAVLSEATWPAKPQADWQDAVYAIAHGVWRTVRNHPHAIPLILTTRARSVVTRDLAESLLAALARSGRTRDALLVAFRAVTAFVMGFAQAELAGPLAIQAKELPAEVIAKFRSLPNDRYPHLRQIAEAASTSKAENQFREGLGALLAGLAITE